MEILVLLESALGLVLIYLIRGLICAPGATGGSIFVIINGSVKGRKR